MKTRNLILPFFILLLTISTVSFGQEKKKFEGPRARIGVHFQYASNFKNVTINYSGLGYTGQLGGFTGKGAELFFGYKPHKYLIVDLSVGVLLNSYSRTYDANVFITGRFNKYYLHPNVKFIYPLIKGGFGTINPFVGGGIGINGTGRYYLEDQYYGFRAITYARFEPMIAPFFLFGTELHFNDLSNLIIGVKYQNGSYTAKEYYDDYNPFLNVKTAPEEIKNFSAQGIGIMIGIMHEF